MCSVQGGHCTLVYMCCQLIAVWHRLMSLACVVRFTCHGLCRPSLPPVQLMRRMAYNSTEGTWTLQSSAPAVGSRGGSAALPKRPASAAHGRGGSAARSPANVLLELQLDIPERQGLDLSNLQFALDAVTAQV